MARLPLVEDDLKRIAEAHYMNGRLLFDHSDEAADAYHGACYIAGYTIEAIIKLAICKAKGCPDYSAIPEISVLDPEKGSMHRNNGVHDPRILFLLLEVSSTADKFVWTLTDWLPKNRGLSPVFDWDAKRRYKPDWRETKNEAEEFLDSIYNLYIEMTKEL